MSSVICLTAQWHPACILLITIWLIFFQVKIQNEMENSFIFKFSGGNAGANF